MITIETTRFGKVELTDPKILKMQGDGILGFSHLKEFVLLVPDEKKPFWWLQSLEDGKVAFLVIDPFSICENYEPDLSPKQTDILDIEDVNDVTVLCIVTVNKQAQLKITANLRAPIVINTKNMSARQIVLERDDYDIRHVIKSMDENAAQDSMERIKAVCA